MFRHGEAPWHQRLAASHRATAVSSTGRWLAVKPAADWSSPREYEDAALEDFTQRRNEEAKKTRGLPVVSADGYENYLDINMLFLDSLRLCVILPVIL
jgi:hypothetical protein